MLKEYRWNGGTWQFDEKDAPNGAVEVKRGEPSAKAQQPANKAKAAANRGRTAKAKAAAESKAE